MCRDRLDCFKAEDDAAGSESSRRESCETSVSRFDSRSCSCDEVRVSSSEGLGGREFREAYCEYVWKRASVCYN